MSDQQNPDITPDDIDLEIESLEPRLAMDAVEGGGCLCANSRIP